jgi:electron transfer flavoprotein alpha subunit
MKKILIIGEFANNQISSQTLELVTAAKQINGTISLAVAAPDASTILSKSNIEGVSHFLAIDLTSSHFDAKVQQSALSALIEKVSPDVILGTFNIKSSSFAGGLAAENDFGFASDVVAFGTTPEKLTVMRPMYSGSVLAEIEFITDRPTIILLRPGKWEPASISDGVVTVETLSSSAEKTSTIEHIEDITPEGDIGLKRAAVIFSIGRGIGSAENIDAFRSITQKLDIPLGASRPVIDSGWLPHAHQVGQTGVTVSPKLYVAFGISGALHHLAGMSTSKVIFAINTDPSAPIFSVAQYGAQADILEVAAELNKLI